MLNLLPPAYKEELQKEKAIRLIFVLTALLLLFLVSLTLLLLAVRFQVEAMAEGQRRLVQAQEASSVEQQETKDRISKLNKDMNALQNFYQNQIQASLILERLARVLPVEYRLTSFAYFPQTGAQTSIVAKISITGTGPSGESLVTLRERIDDDPLFVRTLLPANLQENSFTLTSEVDAKAYRAMKEEQKQ